MSRTVQYKNAKSDIGIFRTHDLGTAVSINLYLSLQLIGIYCYIQNSWYL